LYFTQIVSRQFSSTRARINCTVYLRIGNARTKDTFIIIVINTVVIPKQPGGGGSGGDKQLFRERIHRSVVQII